MAKNHLEQLVQIPINSIKLEGSLALPLKQSDSLSALMEVEAVVSAPGTIL